MRAAAVLSKEADMGDMAAEWWIIGAVVRIESEPRPEAGRDANGFGCSTVGLVTPTGPRPSCIIVAAAAACCWAWRAAGPWFMGCCIGK
jgi:hypothetical protein